MGPNQSSTHRIFTNICRFFHSHFRAESKRCYCSRRRAIEVNRPYLDGLLSSLLLDQVAQLALHRLEGVVDDFGQRLVRAVVRWFFVSHQFVSARNGDIDADAELISFVVRVVRLLDRHVAAVNVIAKFFKPRCIIQNEIVDVLGFFQAAIGDVDGQLHNYLDITQHVLPTQKVNAMSS